MAYDNLGELLTNEVSKYCGEHPENGRPMPLYRVAMGLGVSRETLNSWMSGSVTPSLANAVVIAGFLGITLDELVGKTGKASA